jgi:hypothetical protein
MRIFACCVRTGVDHGFGISVGMSALSLVRATACGVGGRARESFRGSVRSGGVPFAAPVRLLHHGEVRVGRQQADRRQQKQPVHRQRPQRRAGRIRPAPESERALMAVRGIRRDRRRHHGTSPTDPHLRVKATARPRRVSLQQLPGGTHRSPPAAPAVYGVVTGRRDPAAPGPRTSCIARKTP